MRAGYNMCIGATILGRRLSNIRSTENSVFIETLKEESSKGGHCHVDIIGFNSRYKLEHFMLWPWLFGRSKQQDKKITASLPLAVRFVKTYS